MGSAREPEVELEGERRDEHRDRGARQHAPPSAMFDPNGGLAAKRRSDAAVRRVTAWANETSANPALCPGWGSLGDARLSVRAVNCTDPECVPVETVLFLTATGWNVSTKVLKEPVDVTREEMDAAMVELCRLARARAMANAARKAVAPSEGIDINMQSDLNFGAWRGRQHAVRPRPTLVPNIVPDEPHQTPHATPRQARCSRRS